ncbi:MAG: PEP/pyruvate-binding domain-containing protein [Thermodesulfobacteriota bacterium]
MMSPWRRPLAWWRSRQADRASRSLAALQTRYQVFRTLLDRNTRAVDAITELGLALRAGDPETGFREQAMALAATVGEMAEDYLALGGERAELVQAIHRRLAALLAEALANLAPPASLPLTLAFPAITPAQERQVGNKAASLARLGRSGRYPIPAGFAIPAPACRLFLQAGDLALQVARLLGRVLDSHDPAVWQEACDRIAAAIAAAPVPAALAAALAEAAGPVFRQGRTLAVRSSALAEDGREHSFAGQFRSVLNVASPAALLDAFRQVVASAFSPHALAYRRHAGLDPLAFDMAVLCLEMVPARAAGVLLTRAPDGSGGGLVSAVLGLGEAAVAGRRPADVLVFDASGRPDPARSLVAVKTSRLVLVPGGIAEEAVPEAEQGEPAIPAEQVAELARWGREIEEAAGGIPQDIEWALNEARQLVLLQARPLAGGVPLAPGRQGEAADPPGPLLLAGGLTASPGRASGRVRLVRRRADLVAPAAEPLVLVLASSLPDAAGAMGQAAAVLVELGNPADHLANVAREEGVPMLCSLAGVGSRLNEGQWVLVDATSRKVWSTAAAAQAPRRRRPPPAATDPRLAGLRELLVRLHLTDAYGPTFNLRECRSFHDLVRFIHEKAVMAMFEGGDAMTEAAAGLVHLLAEDGIPFPVAVIDLGGGLRPGCGRRLAAGDLRSTPLRALWQGVVTPGLHWGPAPGGAGAIGSVLSSFLTDHRSDRPVGLPNYALVGHDHLNLNARMDFHFVMIDALAGLDERVNHLRFRFKGGGSSAEHRQRRARAIAEILAAAGLYADVRDDLVNASLHAAPAALILERLVSLGRLLGFTRLLDAGMGDDAMAHRAAQAFLEGDFAMASLGRAGAPDAAGRG